MYNCRRHQLWCALSVAILLAVVQPVLASQALMSPKPIDSVGASNLGRPISLVVEEGRVTDEIPLAELLGPEHLQALLVADELRLEIVSGNVRFVGSDDTVMTLQAATLPALRPSLPYHESVIHVFAQGRLIRQAIRVVALPEADFAETVDVYVPQFGAAVRIIAEHMIVVDESQLAIESNEGTQLDFSGILAPSMASKGLCIRTPLGPGKVEWTWSNPSSYPYYYSYKPESGDNLIYWASAPSDDIDGVYRYSWGCCTALKVPDSCTATWYSNDSYSCCCNAAMMALGHVCEWINPCNLGDWVNCPK